MTQKKRQRTEAFLISEAAPHKIHVLHKTKPGPESREVTKAFPNVRVGNEFVVHCLAHVDSCQVFGAMAVRMDGLERHTEEADVEKERTTLTRAQQEATALKRQAHQTLMKQKVRTFRQSLPFFRQNMKLRLYVTSTILYC